MGICLSSLININVMSISFPINISVRDISTHINVNVIDIYHTKCCNGRKTS